MNWFELLLIILVVYFNFVYGEPCPSGQYLNPSGSCTDCKQCKGNEHIVIRPCAGRSDTLCGSIYDLPIAVPEFANTVRKRNKNEISKKNNVELLNKRKPATRKNYDDSYDYDEDYEDETELTDITKVINRKRIDKKSNSKLESDNSQNILKNTYLELPFTSKMDLNKNGKHIKKDLSRSDIIVQTDNSSSIAYNVRSKSNEYVTKSSLKKGKGKKNLTDSENHSVTIGNTKFVISNEDKISVSDNNLFKSIHPHVEDRRIYVDMENQSSENRKASTMFAAKSDEHNSFQELQEYLDALVDNTNEQRASKKMLNSNTLSPLSSKAHSQDQLMKVLDNAENDTLLENDSKLNKTDLINDSNKNDIDESEDDEDTDVDESDDDDEEDDDDDDDDNLDLEDDDDDEDDSDEDDDEDDESNQDGALHEDKTETKYAPFGGVDLNSSEIEDETEKMDEDEDFSNVDGDTSKDVKWYHSGNEVNVEPYSMSNDWQLLTTVSAASACLLFFIMVNICVCVYMKKWKHLKSNFEADVEDFSVRINLMQHGGFEPEESNIIKNFIKQLKGKKNICEKLPTANLREK